MYRRRTLLIVSTFVVAFIVLTHAIWLKPIGGFLIVCDPVEPVDAVVPLAGGPFRVEVAAQLFHRGYAEWFVATDLDHAAFASGQLISEKIINEALAYDVPGERIHLIARPVVSTYTEAHAVRTIAEEQGWQSLIVVTNGRHTRRSHIIFHDVFRNSDIKLIFRPAPDLGGEDLWWQNSWQRYFVFQEYVKLFAFLLGYRSGAETLAE